MSTRGARRFIADLLAGRRPRPFRAGEADLPELRAAITLRAAQPDGATPRAEFREELHQRLSAALATETDRPSHVAPARPSWLGANTTRRALVARAAGIATVAAAAGAAAEHALTSGKPAPSTAQETLTPNTGTWHTVSTSTELTEGAVQRFDLGTVTGFITRTDGAVAAVSGICTHLGCTLALNASARRLDCPCHTTSFALDGHLLRYQLAVPPRPLPTLQVRETDGVVQVYAPDTAV
ncbi:MAG: Rieske 2Fe-2S domain-containing protein [Pseudonocardiales bacterium]|nr:Rieske 2Fe-2S domain-containing protein [Pseudonocardiales bacterium]